MANKRFLTDKEMSELEANQPKPILTDKEMADLESSVGIDQGPVLTAADRAADVLTAGYLPQIEAGLEQLIPGSKTYVQRRDELIKTLKKEQEANPASSMVGTGAGIIGSALAMPGFGAAKAASNIPALAGQVAKNVSIGAGIMMAQNPGDVEGKVDPLQLEERAINLLDTAKTPLGAGSLAMPAIMPMVGYGAQKLAGKIPVAEKMAYSATGPTSGQVKGDLATSPEQAEKVVALGRYALDKGYIPNAVDEIYFKSKNKLQEYGQKIGDIYRESHPIIEQYLTKNLDKVGSYFEEKLDFNNSKEMLKELSNKLVGSPNRGAVLSKMDEYMSGLSTDYGDLFIGQAAPDLEQLHKLKTRLGQSISWSKTNDEIPEIQEAYKFLLGKVNGAIGNEIRLYDKVIGGATAQTLKKLNRDYHLTDRINQNSLGRAASEMSGRNTITQQASNKIGDFYYGQTANALNNMEKINSKSYTPMMLNGPQHEPEFSGYPASMTQVVQPGGQEYNMVKSTIEQAPTLSTIERAKRLNLLNKYGRVYLGQ